MQRFLQEHGEVQLSALGLGTSLLVCSVSCLLFPAHPRHDGKDETKSSLACSYLFDGDRGRDFEGRALGC